MTLTEGNKNALIIACGVVGTISTVAWACAIGNIYSPASPKKTALEVCAYYSEARSSVFCAKLAERAAEIN